jgi:hypothetical protein
MTIRELRLLPPLAIGRLGSATEPMDNYTIEDDPDRPLGYRRLRAEATLVVGKTSGKIRASRIPATLEFKQDGRIRPVAPFLEVFALTDKDVLEPLTLGLLHEHGLHETMISWRAVVANRKVVRRTGHKHDLVKADTGWFADHVARPLEGHCPNFISPRAFVDFGQVRYITPTGDFPEIRLRFTPAKGLIYGPSPGKDDKDPMIAPECAIYDRTKGWLGFGDDDDEGGGKQSKSKGAKGKKAKPKFHNETLPPSLFAIKPPAPSWLHNNVAISRGYLDDACDGFVQVRLTLPHGTPLTASARICASPPALVPDSLFVRSLADDLDQVINGPDVSTDEAASVTRRRAEDIVRRAYETVRFMNVALLNGNNFKGRSALSLDSMPEEEAANTQRAIRPVMSPGTVDTFTIMALHEQVYAALRGGAAPWFVRLLRQPDEVADFTDRGRRKMPALMCGADNNYLALTHRQINTIRTTSERSIFEPSDPAPAPEPGKLTPRNLTAQVHYEAAGNPVSSRPVTSVANCCPGLEFDFRAVWRRIFKGLVLREYDSLVVDVDRDCPKELRFLKGHRLLRVYPPGDKAGIAMVTQITGPAASDPSNEVKLTTDMNPAGLAPLEWSNALVRVLPHKGKKVRCEFTKDKAWELKDLPVPEPGEGAVSAHFEVRPFFADDTAVIAEELAAAGELTQGLCSPWQNDYRECSCYYWASARPDYVNVEPTESGLSRGDNWLQKVRTGDYVPDDYTDSRLLHYDDLFLRWEHWLRFQIGGRDLPHARDAGLAEDDT